MFVAFAHVPLAFAILCVDCQSCGMVKVGACHPLRKVTVQPQAIFFFKGTGEHCKCRTGRHLSKVPSAGQLRFFLKRHFQSNVTI